MAFSLVWQIWELICRSDNRIDPDDLIQLLENAGYECPDDLRES